MLKDEYRQKLIQFNSTEKYKSELRFLEYLVAPLRGGIRILDYGCGIGTAIRYLNLRMPQSVFGYDVENYGVDEFYFRSEYYFQFNSVYFMHSIAHIPNIENELVKIKNDFLKPEGIVSVITPNKAWMDLNKNPDYIPDPTVVKHFYADELEKLFVSAGYKILQQGQFGQIKDRVNERLFIQATI